MTELTKSMREEFDEAIGKGEQPKMRRVLALDFGRGWAIFFVIFIHATVFNAFGGNVISGDTGGSEITTLTVIIMTPFIILGSWASIFAIVTGAASALSVYNHLVIKKRPAALKIKSNLIRFTALIIINFIYLYFFIHPTENIMGEPTQSLITGSIQNLRWIIPSGAVLFHSSAFIMIGFSDFIVTMIMVLLYRKDGNKKYKRNFIILLVIVCIFLYASPAIQHYLTPLAQSSYQNGNYIIAMILTWLVGTKHCIFPFVGFAINGAIFGLMLVQERNAKNMLKYGHLMIVFNIIVFIISVILNIVLLGRLDLFGSSVQHFSFYIMNYILQMFLVLWALNGLEFKPKEKRKKFANNTVGLRRFGTISLTCFLIEQPIAAIFALITETLIPGSMSKMYILVLWVPLYAYLWWMVVHKWDQKKNMKGSLEYMLASIGKSKEQLNGCPDLLCLN